MEITAKAHEVLKHEAEHKAARYMLLLREALEVLPGRGSLRRRIIQTIANDQ